MQSAERSETRKAFQEHVLPSLYLLLKITCLIILAVYTYLQYRLAFASGGIGVLPVTYQPYGAAFYAILFDNPALWLGLIIAIFYELRKLLYLGITLQALLFIADIHVYLEFLERGAPNFISGIVMDGALLFLLAVLVTVRSLVKPSSTALGWQRPIHPLYPRFLKGLAITLWVILIWQLIQYMWAGGFLWVMSSWGFWFVQTLYVVFLGYFVFCMASRPRPVVVYLIVMIPMLVYGCLLGLGVITGPTTILSKLEGLIFGLLALLAVYHWVRDFIL